MRRLHKTHGPPAMPLTAARSHDARDLKRLDNAAHLAIGPEPIQI